MTAAWRLLRSPRLALAVLAFLALYCGVAAWLPWQRPGTPPPPGWAAALHLDHPFSSPAFLAATLLLFLSTAVCTWDRTVRVIALSRGQVRPWGTPFPSRGEASFVAFCRSEGFRGEGPVLFRARPAFWGGWLLHVGLLSLIAGILLQQGFHDGAAFQLAEGEKLRLDVPGALFGREKGPFAPDAPPALTVGLTAFDPLFHRKGYAPDRACLLHVRTPGGAERSGAVDRAAGFDAGPVTVYQAIPSGLALVVEVEGVGVRAFHLREEGPLRHAASFHAPGGAIVRFAAECERRLDDPVGTGLVRLRASGPRGDVEVVPGGSFEFGTVRAKVVSIGRWGGFTYSRSPGIAAVFAGFGLVLLGATLMTFPAGVALVGTDGDSTAGWIWVSRGREALLAEWQRLSPGEPGAGGS